MGTSTETNGAKPGSELGVRLVDSPSRSFRRPGQRLRRRGAATRERGRRLRAAIYHRKVGKPAREGESLAQLRGLAAFILPSDPVKGRRFLDELATLSD